MKKNRRIMIKMRKEKMIKMEIVKTNMMMKMMRMMKKKKVIEPDLSQIN